MGTHDGQTRGSAPTRTEHSATSNGACLYIERSTSLYRTEHSSTSTLREGRADGYWQRSCCSHATFLPVVVVNRDFFVNFAALNEAGAAEATNIRE